MLLDKPKTQNQLDLAIELNNDDYLLYYLRGRWSFKVCLCIFEARNKTVFFFWLYCVFCFKIYKLSWAEKYAIKFVFGNIPDNCLEAAFDDFSKVELLNKNKSKGNLLHLAKVSSKNCCCCFFLLLVII